MDPKEKKYYFLGIGGIGMSALAKYLFDLGNPVMGYDKTPSTVTSQLVEHGILVVFDETVDAIPQEYRQKDTQVIFTPAVPSTQPQFQFFTAQGNDIKKRSKLLGEITQNTMVFAIAGTHGKTTTAAFLTHLFTYLDLDFTAFLGGIMKESKSNLIQNGRTYSIVEADEYDRSFLQLSPDYACVTAIDADHLDIYGDYDNMKKAFIEFSNSVSEEVIIAKGVDLEGKTFAVGKKADYSVQNLRLSEHGYHFDLHTPKGAYEEIYLNAIGQHNLSNALGALALIDAADLPLEKALPALAVFQGIERRMEIFTLENKILIDDYAHHPEEIKAVLKTVSEFYPNKSNMVVFQPHLFSRTQDFLEPFAQVLDQFDEVVLMDIYPAREQPIEGVTSELLLDRMKNQNKRKINKEAFESTIVNSKAELVLILGAGDIGNHIQKLKKTA